MDNKWVKIKTQEVEAFAEHINSVDRNIRFTREDVKDNQLPFLDCDVHIGVDRSLHIGVYRKPTHTDQYLLFDSHHPLEHKLGVIRLYYSLIKHHICAVSKKKSNNTSTQLVNLKIKKP